MRHLPGLWSDFCFICLLILKALRSAFYSLEQINDPLVNKTCKLCCIYYYSHLTVWAVCTVILQSVSKPDGSKLKKKKDGDPSVHRGLVLVFILYGERTRDDAVLMDDTLQNFLSHMCLLFYIRSSSFQVHLPFDTFLFFALLASPLSCL